MRAWTCCDTGASVKWWQGAVQPPSKCRRCHQLHPLPSTTVPGCTSMVHQWMDQADSLKPEDWGWSLNNGRYEPKTADLPPAPSKLLKVIRCTCRQDCSSRNCTCRKHGMECSRACGGCRGLSCTNIQPELDSDEGTIQFDQAG